MIKILTASSLFAGLFLTKMASANDTLRVMHYNLMYYDNYYSVAACNASSNNVNSKDGYLSTIIDYYKPDIFTVNEINSEETSVQRLLNNALNVNGSTHYRRASYYSPAVGIANMLYYNSDKIALKSQTFVPTEPRITNVYTLYYKPELSSTPLDTIFITCFVIHPKSSNTSSDINRRTAAATLIMDYIAQSNLQGNVMLLGDLNVYTATEGSFVKYTSPTTTGFRFYDPINQLGLWNNAAFAPFHTQSTHTSGTCFSTGGMDDRFDFILTSLPLLQDNNRLRFVNGTYKALGQDGNRYNGSLISPSNTSLPAHIIDALYNMSDHLPVTLKLFVNGQTSVNQSFHFNLLNVSINNPVSEYLTVRLNEPDFQHVSIEVFDLMGKRVASFKGNSSSLSVPVSDLGRGLYLVKISNGLKSVVKKIIKQ